MATEYETMTDRYTPAEIRSMAAVSRMTPRGERDNHGRLLPARYRVAERMVAQGIA